MSRRRLDNATWEEYINKFDACNGTVTLKDFCIENKLSKSQFYYHKRRLANGNSVETTFHAVSLNFKQDSIEERVCSSSEVKITVGNAVIAIPASETALIASIIKELATRC
jgi:hypothetical protein